MAEAGWCYKNTSQINDNILSLDVDIDECLATRLTGVLQEYLPYLDKLQSEFIQHLNGVRTERELESVLNGLAVGCHDLNGKLLGAIEHMQGDVLMQESNLDDGGELLTSIKPFTNVVNNLLRDPVTFVVVSSLCAIS